jgi:hypothetical protein
MKISYLTPSREYVQILRHNTVLEENKKKHAEQKLSEAQTLITFLQQAFIIQKDITKLSIYTFFSSSTTEFKKKQTCKNIYIYIRH